MDQQAETPESYAQRMAIVETLALGLKEKRATAIEGRKQSGIEEIWDEDEAHYDGNDALTGGAWSKGRNSTDGLRENSRRARTGSTVFLKITRGYVDAAAARVADMLLPTDDRNWALKPTPVPDLAEGMKDTRPVSSVLPVPPQRPGMIRRAINGLMGAQPQPEPTVADLAKHTMDKATKLAETAQTQIDDWHVECRYHAEVRKVIEATAKLGTGILKGPTPKKMRKRAVTRSQDGSWVIAIEQKISPESREVSCRNIYPDPACGDNIHDGSYIWEADDITARKLMDLKGLGYLDDMIDMCLEEGPMSEDGTRKLPEGQKTAEKDLFRIWYFHGYVSSKEMEAAGCRCDKELSFYPCLVTMVNDRVIKVALNPLDSGEFPYDVMVWQARADHWAGAGVSRQMRECQKGANAAIRNVMDNAGLSAGPQIIVDRTKIVPANGKWEIAPRKVWWTKDAADVADVTKAFFSVEIPMLQDKLMPIVQFWLQKAEDTTGLPMLLQGQQGKAPDTVGGMQIMNNNGSTVLRRIARTFDDRVTEPHIARYYEYLLLHGPDEAKGDFTIDARGSSALIERDMQAQQLPGLLQASLNPAYGLDPELLVMELLKGWRIDPKRVTLSDEKKAEMAQRQAPPAPQVQAAQIREQGASQRKQMELGAQAQEGDLNRKLEVYLKGIDAQLAREGLTEDARQALDDHKVDMATLAMKLRTQKELSPGPQVSEPPTEPVGRAPDGNAYPQ